MLDRMLKNAFPVNELHRKEMNFVFLTLMTSSAKMSQDHSWNSTK